MIKVNLVPAEFLAKAKRRQLMMQGVVVGSLMALVLVAVSFGHWYGKRTLEQRLAYVESELQRLDRIVKQVEELEKAAAAVLARLGVIENLLLGRAYYPIFMSEFVRTVPAGVRVNAMTTGTVTPGTIKLSINAIANSNEDIAAWVKTMEKNSRFAMIELGAVSATGLTSYAFTMTATYTSN